MKRLSRIFGILTGLTAWVFAVCVLTAACTLYLPGVFGVRPYMVLSGSMEPELPTGSLAYIQDTGETYEPGDVVAFTTQDLPVVHRIYACSDDGGFLTKGDANEYPDARTTYPSDILGECVLVVPNAGYLVSALQTRTLTLGSLSVPVPAALAAGILITLSALETAFEALAKGKEEEHPV